MKPPRYHPALVALHWLLAVFIVGALVLGMFVLKTLPTSSPGKIEALRAHMIGSPILDRIARISHIAFYGLVAGMVATGLATAVLAGLPDIVFGASGAPLPESFAIFPTRVIHGVLAKLLVTLIFVHASAALYHHFIRHDRLLARMWFGRQPG